MSETVSPACSNGSARGSADRLSSSPWNFADRRVLIVGAAHGIGAAAARAFHASEASLVLSDNELDPLVAMAAELGGVRTEYEDLGTGRSIADLAQRVGAVDVLVVTAGMLLSGPLVENDEQALRRLVDVDLLGPALLLKAFGPLIRSRPGASVVLVGSQLAFSGAAHRALYGACKAALSHLGASLAVEWAPEVRVVTIAPGRISTRFSAESQSLLTPSDIERSIALARFGTAEEVADAICFAASRHASYVTGTTLVVDGGYLAM